MLRKINEHLVVYENKLGPSKAFLLAKKAFLKDYQQGYLSSIINGIKALKYTKDNHLILKAQITEAYKIKSLMDIIQNRAKRASKTAGLTAYTTITAIQNNAELWNKLLIDLTDKGVSRASDIKLQYEKTSDKSRQILIGSKKEIANAKIAEAKKYKERKIQKAEGALQSKTLATEADWKVAGAVAGADKADFDSEETFRRKVANITPPAYKRTLENFLVGGNFDTKKIQAIAEYYKTANKFFADLKALDSDIPSNRINSLYKKFDENPANASTIVESYKKFKDEKSVKENAKVGDDTEIAKETQDMIDRIERKKYDKINDLAELKKEWLSIKNNTNLDRELKEKKLQEIKDQKNKIQSRVISSPSKQEFSRINYENIVREIRKEVINELVIPNKQKEAMTLFAVGIDDLNSDAVTLENGTPIKINKDVAKKQITQKIKDMMNESDYYKKWLNNASVNKTAGETSIEDKNELNKSQNK